MIASSVRDLLPLRTAEGSGLRGAGKWKRIRFYNAQRRSAIFHGPVPGELSEEFDGLQESRMPGDVATGPAGPWSGAMAVDPAINGVATTQESGAAPIAVETWWTKPHDQNHRRP